MTTPRVQKNKTAESPGMEDSACLDLSIKQVWLIVHFADSDPGNEFEIVSDKQLVGDSWETLEKGVEVVVAYGNAKVQGTVLTVSGKRIIHVCSKLLRIHSVDCGTEFSSFSCHRTGREMQISAKHLLFTFKKSSGRN